jgi:hypothetical protein
MHTTRNRLHPTLRSKSNSKRGDISDTIDCYFAKHPSTNRHVFTYISAVWVTLDAPHGWNANRCARRKVICGLPLAIGLCAPDHPLSKRYIIINLRPDRLNASSSVMGEGNTPEEALSNLRQNRAHCTKFGTLHLEIGNNRLGITPQKWVIPTSYHPGRTPAP